MRATVKARGQSVCPYSRSSSFPLTSSSCYSMVYSDDGCWSSRSSPLLMLRRSSNGVAAVCYRVDGRNWSVGATRDANVLRKHWMNRHSWDLSNQHERREDWQADPKRNWCSWTIVRIMRANQERWSSLAVWVTCVVLMSASTMHGNDLLKENNDSRKAWRCSMSDRLCCLL